MRRTRRIALMGIAAVAWAPTSSLAGQVGPTRSQAEIALALLSTNRDTVAHALAEVPVGYDPDDLLGWRFPPDYVVTPELATALIGALDGEARRHMDGCTVTGIGGKYPELSLELLHHVIALRDPASIPALVQMICSGGAVRQALLEFGPVIVPHVVEWAQSPDAAWADISGSLFTLGEAVDRWGETLPPQARASIGEVALQYLGPAPKRISSSVRRGFLLESAIQLASMLRDPDLLTAMEEVAAEGHPALDGMDPKMAASLRDRARLGLAGSLWKTQPRRRD